VGGFQNSTDSDRIPYTISFLYQDQAGIFVPPSSVSACSLTPVYASAVQGFLGKSNCFIATAAFGSGDSPPVLLLREFRDTVLLKFSLGQELIQFYYRWSPSAAEWLIENPVFRLPVLLFLAPVEIFAWIVLHLGIGFTFCLGALVSLLLLVWVRFGRVREG
jgi:hypothetical protein